jgi:hypothetical protein
MLSRSCAPCRHLSSMHITQKHVSQVDLQIVKRGYQLAIWLNTIFG